MAKMRRVVRSRPLLYTLGGIVLASMAVFLVVDRSIVHRFETRTTSLPSRVYARPFTVQQGGRLDPSALLDRLDRLGYREVPAGATPSNPGEFLREGNDWTLYLRSAVTPEGSREALPVRLDVRFKRLRRITDVRDGARLDAFSLEPERLVTFYADVMEERRWTPLEEIPEDLRNAVVVVEDRRFRRHFGVDLLGIGRALAANARAGGVVQGGSTITQQLAKNLYGPGKRSLRRKVLETVASVALELHYDKDAILEAYLNEVYLGQLGPVAVSGVGDASRFFFGTPVGDLDLARSALLAGMIRNPGRYNPRRHPDEARNRRDVVLRLMHERGAIDDARLGEARAARIRVVDAAEVEAAGRFPWIEDYLAGAMAPVADGAVPSSAGYSVFTTFDPRIQRVAEEALRAGLKRLERRGGRDADPDAPLEGAIVVLRPDDGAVVALVGGRDHGRSQYDRAVQARRSPGSTFKPFVFLAGLERAQREPDFAFTVATMLDDAPLEVRAGGETWSPRNYDRGYRGAVTVRDALEQSINVPTVRAALQVGLSEVVETAHRCGIDSPLQPVPSLALGAEAVTPLELAAAYATLANGGWRIRPHGIEALIDRDGLPYALPPLDHERVIEPELAWLVTDLLVGVVERGTGRSAASLGFTGVAAGKTGTSDGLRDAWFVGYTPDVLALVWVGHDDNRPVGLTGAAAALPIWVDLMKRIGEDDADAFPRPAGIVRERVDPTTGLLATRRCPESRQEVFLRGTEPQESCTAHGGRERKRGLFKRWFGRKG